MMQGQHLVQRLTLDVVHDQKLLVAKHEVIGDARQIGMPQPGQDFGFALELSPGLLDDPLARFRRITHPFEGNPASKDDIFGVIHRTHRALPHQQDQAISIGENLIRVQHCAACCSKISRDQL